MNRDSIFLVLFLGLTGILSLSLIGVFFYNLVSWLGTMKVTIFPLRIEYSLLPSSLVLIKQLWRNIDWK